VVNIHIQVNEADLGIELADHELFITVGKLHFNPKAILGKGCDGTKVFRLVLPNNRTYSPAILMKGVNA